MALSIGLFGGSFDPIHLGHLLLAQDAVEFLGLDRLFFVPTATSPLKDAGAVASGADRLEMLRLAVQGDPRFEVLDVEVRRGGVSYSVDTAREMRRRFPGVRLFWAIGADQVIQLAHWREIEALAGMVEFAAFARPDCGEVVPPAIPGLRLQQMPARMIRLSSSEIRLRAQRGLPLRHFVPLKVFEFIESKSLYRSYA